MLNNKPQVTGILLVTIYCALTAVQSVVESLLVAASSPAFAVFLVFLLVQVVVIFASFARTKFEDVRFALRGNTKIIISVNLLTAVSWLTLYSARAYVEPVIAAIYLIGFVPIMIVSTKIFLVGAAGVVSRDYASAFGTLVIIICLQAYLFFSSSSYTKMDPAETSYVFALCLLSSAAHTALAYQTKIMLDRKCSYTSVLVVRYPLVVLLAGLVMGYGGEALPPDFPILFMGSSVIAALTLGARYFYLAGLSRLEVVSTNFIYPLGLALVYIFQFIDPRVEFRPVIAVFVIGLMATAWFGLPQLRYGKEK